MQVIIPLAGKGTRLRPHTHLVPTMFHRLLALPDDVKARYDVSSVLAIIHGAAPCPVPVKRRIIDALGARSRRFRAQGHSPPPSLPWRAMRPARA